METDRTFLEAKAGRIFSFDKGIRSVALLTADGKSIASVGRPGVAPLEPESETKTVYMKASIAVSMGASMNKYFGPLRTVILIRERVMIVCFNLSARMMLISAVPDFPLQKVEQLGQLVDELSIG